MLFGLGLSFEEKTPIQTDPQKWVDQSSQTVKDVEAVADQTATATELGVFVTAPDVFSDEAAEVRHRPRREPSSTRYPDTLDHGVVALDDRLLPDELRGRHPAAPDR